MQCEPPQNCGLPARLRRDRGKGACKICDELQKPTFWIILLAVAACVVLAVCFLTNPIGFRYDAAADPIVSAKYFDARNHTDPIAVDLSAAQIDELSSRLDGLKT